ncbi:MAG: hypothetical protein OCU22_09290 [Canidatus Methanoxibalbensis ujae]|nr:hypothetical protein [Candidatus Methanoxibalbensis ujae]
MFYYKGFRFTGSGDEKTIVSLTSTEEEPIRIHSVVLTYFNTSNYAILYSYIEREKVIDEIRTKNMSTEYKHEFEINIDVPVGQTFYLTGKNGIYDQNTEVIGYVKYEIK